jgi:hypothetical protein
MKIAFLLTSLGGAAVALAHAADPVLPDFNSNAIGHPPLSLRDIARDAPARKGDFNPPLSSTGPARPRPARPKVTYESGMPIVEPNPNVQYKMVMKAPDPQTDFKMIVKPVDEPAK